MSKCTSITKIDTLSNGTDVLNVTIDDVTSALWFYDYAEALKYVGQDVIVEYRQDVYNGALQLFIATFVIPTVVQTLDKQDNIKLFCDQVDNFSNLSFNEIEIGETRQGCIVYCTACEFKSSNAAVWQELTIRDRSMHTAKLRLFDYDNKAADFAGQYIMTELSRNKYGFQSELINPVNGECPPNPEIAIAIQFIHNYFCDDEVSMSYIENTKVLDFLKDVIDYEKGYGLMRLAMELSIVDSMQNVSRDVDYSAIGRALLASRGHVCSKSVLSPTFNNMVVAHKYMWDNRKKVLQLLDENLEEKVPEYAIMQHIKSMVSAILDVRKGTPLK